MNNIFLGIDLGTSGCEIIICSSNKGILAETEGHYGLITTKQGYVEQDANTWWSVIKTAINKSVRDSGINKTDIDAICVTSQGLSFVPVDKNVKPLHNAISWLDTRASEQTTEILDKVDMQTVYKITGKRVHPVYTLPKLLWLQQTKPKLFKKTYKFLLPMDFITAKLTNEFVTDHTLAAGTLMYDITKLGWSEKILAKFPIPISKLPDIKWAGTKVGHVTAKTAAETGLSTKTVVITGAQDQKCAALAAGLDKKTATFSLGTAGAILFHSTKPVFDKQMRVPCFPYVQPGTWVLESVISTSGAAVAWANNLLGLRHDTFEQCCNKTVPGSNGVMFMPHLAGATSPHWDETVKAGFHGLTLSATKNDLARSVLEGIAYEVKLNFDVVNRLSINPDKIHAFGGGTKNMSWLKIISSVLNKPVVKLNHVETTCLGACVLAGLKEKFSTGLTITPDKQLEKTYEKLYNKYIATAYK
jgi:xylulokinase